MTQSGSLYANALAERVSGIIKNEFFPKKIYKNQKEAKKNSIIIIDHYNLRRPHSSLDCLTPNQAHQISGTIKKGWKGYPRQKKVKEVNQVEVV